MSGASPIQPAHWLRQLMTVRELRWHEMRAAILADAVTDIERETLERCLPVLPSSPLMPDYELR